MAKRQRLDLSTKITETQTASLASGSLASKKYVLRSKDGETFVVEENVAAKSKMIKNMIDDGCAGDVIPVYNVTAKILAKVLEYSRKHVEAEAVAEDMCGYIHGATEELEEWDEEFVKVDQNTLFDLILAANYLDIKELLDLTCQTVADMMRGETPSQIRKKFHIVNNYSPEEEEELMREISWAFKLTGVP